MDELKRNHLKSFAAAVEQSARSGRLTGKPITLRKMAMVDGPRAGGLDIGADYDVLGDIRAALVKNDCAALRGLLSWEFVGEPSAYFQGRALRIEAGWTDALSQRDILVSDLTLAADVGQWVTGRAENGRVVFASVSDDASHWLVAGLSGSGKTVALFSAVCQLIKTCRVVLLDMKGGRDLRTLEGARGMVGPLVSSVALARLALTWAVGEMETRYLTRSHDAPIVIICDEVQVILEDGECLGLFKSILTRGREVGINSLCATQYPDAKTLQEPTVQKGFGGRIGLRTTSQDASRVVLGNSAFRCDTLLGRGDAIVKSARGEIRVQIARFDGEVERGGPDLAEWPTIGKAEPTMPEQRGAFSGNELAVSLIVARNNGGRDALKGALTDSGIVAPGNGRGARLLGLGKETLSSLHSLGFDVRAKSAR